MKERTLGDLMPIMEINDDLLISTMGDYSVAFEIIKPEIFTLSASDFDAYHETWMKAIRLLPYSSIVHMQDWYTSIKYQADSKRLDGSMLTEANERFFHDRSGLDHRSYLFVTKRTAKGKSSTSATSTLLGKTLIPAELLQRESVQEFLDQVMQFERILKDSKFVQIRRLTADELAGTSNQPGIIEQYCQLVPPGQSPQLADIDFYKGMRIGDKHCFLYTLADVEHLPAQCSSHVNYLPYSTDRTPFPISFAAPLGLLLHTKDRKSVV